MLTLENVKKSFGQLRAVDGVSLTVPAGQIIGLIGPNGSGKSTLLSIIAGSQPADSGRILLEGRDITGLPAYQIYRLGLVRSYQDPALFFRMTALDNMLLPVKEQRGEDPAHAPLHRTWRAEESHNAHNAGATLDQLQLWQAYDTLAADLSGGQMKLLELGRSLMGAPRILLLDEPTAGVAPALAYTIFEQIEAMRRTHGLTFLIVEHRLEILFDFVDHLYVMHLGNVIAQGTPDEIAANTQVREVYFGE
ncbi:MAG: ABC transporter ATP-binding protein [Chloroflexi bacterium]|nr:MAG: ABC transporter ATP-binding protein [Chloroflexota bacterium]